MKGFVVGGEHKVGLETGSPSGSGGEVERPRLHKAVGAFRTISEVADELHVPQHVLRFWESKFPQVRPLKRGGGRRYYRPEDVLLLRRVADLLYTQGYTIKGVQRLLRDHAGSIPLPAVTEEPSLPLVQIPEESPEPLEGEPDLEPDVAQETLPAAEEVGMPVATSESVDYGADEVQRLRAALSEALLALEELRRILG